MARIEWVTQSMCRTFRLRDGDAGWKQLGQLFDTKLGQLFDINVVIVETVGRGRWGDGEYLISQHHTQAGATMGTVEGHRSKHLCKVDSSENLREGEAPAEPTVQWFGRSLTLPSNELLR